MKVFFSFRRRRRRWFKLCRHTMEEAWAKKYTLNSFTCISVSINQQYQYVYQIWSMSVKWMVMLRFCVLRWKLVRWRMVEWMLFVWKVKYGTERHTGHTQNEQQQKHQYSHVERDGWGIGGGGKKHGSNHVTIVGWLCVWVDVLYIWNCTINMQFAYKTQ